MRKSGIITIMTAAAILGSAMVAQASPLKDYSAGHVAIDLGYSNPTSLNFTEHGSHGKEGSVYGGATVGIGNKMAVGYKYNQFKSDGYPKVTAQQLNLYYKAIPGVSVYGGLVNARTHVVNRGETQNSGQIGVQAAYDIPLFATVYGNIGVGNKMNSWEVGLSKALVNNLDLNVSYFDNRFKDIEQGGDVKAHGINVGLTLKF